MVMNTIGERADLLGETYSARDAQDPAILTCPRNL